MFISYVYNIEFLKKQIKNFETTVILEPTLENYLLYEEYYLRQMFINGRTSKKEYLERMKKFFINYGYKFIKNENGFYLDIDDKVYDVDYKEGRIKIR